MSPKTDDVTWILMDKNWLFTLFTEMNDTSGRELPEQAIGAFEMLTGLRLTLHDLTASLWPYLSPERCRHHAPCCLAVKATHDWACMDFEIDRLRSGILSHPDGKCHQCHAGFVEWVVPAVINGRVAWIMFAGQARAGNFRPSLDDRRSSAGGDSRLRLPLVSQERSLLILEAMRQLRARLMEWYLPRIFPSAAERRSNPKDLATRSHTIKTFLFAHHSGPLTVADLANYLGLSESRTIRIVQECFGCGFTTMLSQIRLKTASSLLQNSSLSMQDVCYASGFGDLSNFHRTFRKCFGKTPLQYRKSAGP